MKEYIEREKAIEAFDDPAVERNYGDVCPESVIRVIERIPAADVREVKRGKWEQVSHFVCRCSNCNKYWINEDDKYDFNFCPNCGAKMEES